MKRTFMLFCMMMIVYLQYGSVLFYDDFNRTEGSAVGNSWTNIGPVSPLIENSAMKITSNSLQGVRRDFTSLGITSGIYYISYDWKITSNNWLADAFPNGTITYLRHDYEGNLYYDNTSDFSNPVQMGNLALNTWANFKLKVNLDTDRFSIWINNVLVIDNIAGLAVSDFTRFTFRAGSGSTVTQYIDNFIVYNETAPAVPTALTASGAVNNITLNWTGTPQDFLTYKIYRKTTSPADVFLAEVPATQTSYVDNTAAANTDYFYRVKAVSMSTIESGYSNEVTAHLQPDISVTPQVINVSVGQGYTGSSEITIANNGNYNLNYSVLGLNQNKGSLSFNGSNSPFSYVDLGNFGAQHTFTVSMWIKPSEQVNMYAMLIDCNHSGSYNWCWQRYMTTSNWCQWNLQFPYYANVWQHVAIVVSSGTVNVYVNGVNQGSDYFGSINYGRTPNLLLGQWALGGRAYKGLIDDLHISTVARYSGDFNPYQEITPDSYTYGYWKFDEESGNTCYDSSQYHRNATIVNNVQRSVEIPLSSGWLTSISPLNGVLSSSGQTQINLSVNATNLTSGTHSDTLYVNSNDPDSPSIPVIVNLTVAPGDVAVTPAEFTVKLNTTSNTSSSSFNITNTGLGKLNYTITNNPSPISTILFTPSSGTILTTENQSIAMSINGSTLSDGLYQTSARIISNAPAVRDTIYIPVTVKVDYSPPTAPLGLFFDEAQSDMNQIRMTWTANAMADSVYSYKIYRRGLHDTEWALKGSVNASQRWFIDTQFTGLDTTAVYYKITAVDWVDNEGVASEEVMAWLQRFPAPTGLTMEIIRDRHVKLTWNPVTQTISGNPGTPSCYVIYRSNAPTPLSDFYFVGAVDATTFTHNWAAWFIENSKQFYVVTAYSGSFDDLRTVSQSRKDWKYGELENAMREQAKK